MDRLLQIALGAYIRNGNLQVTSAGGHTFTVGDGNGERLAIRFTSTAAQWGVLFDPVLRLGESYMDGSLQVDEGSIADALHLALSQAQLGKRPWWTRAQWLARYPWRRRHQFNGRGQSRRNVRHHYDLDGRLYSIFLDADRQYSCAYFEQPDQTLDDAQLAKKRHLAAKLLIEPNHRLLEIGSGWGGLAVYLAEICGARIKGITLSEEQLHFSRALAADRECEGEVDFELTDYRDVTGIFDRIVSVGMFEHVGVGFYDAYFRKCAALLADDGVMLLHSIGRSDGPGITNPWIAKYIFPGGYIPALSEVLPAIERAGLLVTDIEILRLHYAGTLKAWRDRLLARRTEVSALYDKRFVRMWEFYLAAAEMSFRDAGMMVFQIQLSKRQGVVPMTRDYIGQTKSRLRQAEARYRVPLRLAGE